MKGELKVHPLTDFPERFRRLGSIFVGSDHHKAASYSLVALLCPQSLKGSDSGGNRFHFENDSSKTIGRITCP